MLGREKAAARVAIFLPVQDFAYWQQFKIAHYDDIMQHHRHQFNFWKPGIPRDTSINWPVFDCCVKEIWENTWVSIFPNIKASALSNLHHPKSTAPVQRGMKGDQFQRPWKPSAGELPGAGEEEATSSLLTWVVLWASEPLSKWPTFNLSLFSSCPPFCRSFHTCGPLMWEGTGFLLAGLFYSPGCSVSHRQWRRRSVKTPQAKSHLRNLKEKKLVTVVVRWAMTWQLGNHMGLLSSNRNISIEIKIIWTTKERKLNYGARCQARYN